MDGNGTFNRIDELFLRSDSPRIFGSSQRVVPAPFSSPQAYDFDKQRTRQSLPSSPTSSSRSSGSSSSATSSSYSGGSEASRVRQSSISSIPSVGAAAPPWQPLQTLDQRLTMTNFDYGYDLPCEFGFSGCHLRFHPENSDDWIDHSVSHFGGHSPPVRAVCTFCDREFDCTYNPNDVRQNWRQRMEHIGRHFYSRRIDGGDGVDVNHPRPDFWVVEYLNSRGLLSPQDYAEAIRYTERPPCDNTYHRGWKPQEMLAREERNSGTNHDLRKEKHHRRKEKGKRSGRTHH